MSCNYLSFSSVFWKGKLLDTTLEKSKKNPSLREGLEEPVRRKEYNKNIFEFEPGFKQWDDNNKMYPLPKKMIKKIKW